MKPVEQRLREGNVEREPLPEPLLIAGRPNADELAPPDGMPTDAVEAWNAVVPTLAEVGLLDRVDRLALHAMCIQWARAMQAGKVINAQGHLIRGMGGLKEHPSLATERKGIELFRKFAAEYGLTAMARTRLGLAELNRRSIQVELESSLGEVDLQEVDDAEVIDDE
jgi:P27 family predicted phage terminase small subunit